jgi:hypothetical protein
MVYTTMYLIYIDQVLVYTRPRHKLYILILILVLPDASKFPRELKDTCFTSSACLLDLNLVTSLITN